jgi:hypothetical protein
MECSLATSLEFGEFKQNAEAMMILLLCAAFFFIYFFMFVSSISDGMTLRTEIVLLSRFLLPHWLRDMIPSLATSELEMFAS